MVPGEGGREAAGHGNGETGEEGGRQERQEEEKEEKGEIKRAAFVKHKFCDTSTVSVCHSQEEEEPPGELREVVRSYSFPCGRWLARGEEDGEILVELHAEDYEDLEGKLNVSSSHKNYV